MGLSSLFRKNQAATEADEGAFSSRAEDESNVVRGRARRKPAKATVAATAAVDPVLPEKKRARRRLVGAIVLVVAAVIGLPMILDSEPKPLSEDVQIQIPSKETSAADAPVHRAAINAGPANVPQGAALDQSEEMVDPATMGSGKKIVVPKHVDERVAALTDKSSPPVVAKVAPKVEPKPKMKAETKPEPKIPVKVAANGESGEAGADSARARAILAGTGGPDKTISKPTHMMVQVAALASKEKVAELRERLKAAGIVSHTQTVSTDSGDKIRVRIGPFASREEADKARAKLTSMGLSGSVVPG